MAVFDLPAKTTCPGMSSWCEKRCYAARCETRWTNTRNFHIATLAFVEAGGVPQPPEGVKFCRIHSFGDFYSADYIDQWIEVVRQRRDVAFWAYTRSWRVPDLLPKLQVLHNEPNMQLFASMDNTIPEAPPIGWRVSWISGDPRASGYTCPAETGRKKSCLDCKYCFLGKKHNLVLIPH